MKDYSQLSAISLQVQKDYSAEARRMNRAAEIVRENKVRAIVTNSLTPTRYCVHSQSKSAEYLVDIDTLTCGCSDARKNQVICKHLLAAIILSKLPEQQMTFDEFLKWATSKIEIPA